MKNRENDELMEIKGIVRKAVAEHPNAAIGGGIGAAMGAAVGGPVGAAVGGAIGGWLGSQLDKPDHK